MRKLAFVLIGLALLVSALNASYLRINTDSSVIGGTTGRAYVWFTNTGDETQFVSVTAELGELNGYFEDFYGVARPGEAVGFNLYYSAPDCFEGFQEIFITAAACDVEGACVHKYTESFRVQVYAADVCRVMMDGEPTPTYFVPNVRGASTISYSRYFDPTEYAVQLTANPKCIEVTSGNWDRVPITLLNKGAAGSFELNLIGDKEKVNAILSNDFVSLNRDNFADLFLDVSPSRTRAGRYWLTLQALFDGVVLAEEDLCFDVLEDRSSEIALPSIVETDTCGPTEVRGVAQNLGVRGEEYSFNLPEFASITPFYLESGEKTEFVITLDSENMIPGQYDLTVKVETIDGILSGEGEAVVLVNECAPQKELVVDTKDDGELLKLVVEVENPLSVVLHDVSIDLEGLPDSWEVLDSESTSIPANSEENIVLWVKPGSESAENVIVLVKQGGEVIAEKQLGELEGKPSGLTGLFTLAMSQNALFISALVVVALVVILLTSKKEDGLVEDEQKTLPEANEKLDEGVAK